MPADGAEPLDDHARLLQREVAVPQRHLGGIEQAPAGGADLIEWDTSHLPRQGDHPPDLVLDPGHAFLVGAHVRGEDIVLLGAQGLGEGPDQHLLARLVHLWVAEEHGLAAAVGEPGRRVLEGHGAGEPEALLDAHVLGHTHPADGGPPGHVVHHQDAAQVDRGFVDVDDLGRAQVVGEDETVLHR